MSYPGGSWNEPPPSGERWTSPLPYGDHWTAPVAPGQATHACVGLQPIRRVSVTPAGAVSTACPAGG
jgi:hypothetical protein